MNILDIIILSVFLIGFILGYKDGIIRKIVGITGLVIAIFVVVKYNNEFGQIVSNITGLELYFSKIVGSLILFFLVISLFSLLKRIIHPFDKVNNLINQLIGAVVGSIQLLFFLSAVFFLLSIFDLPQKTTIDSSLFYEPVYTILPSTVNFIGNYTPEPQKFFDNYTKDTK